MAWRSHARLEDWRSDESLFLAAVRDASVFPRPRLNLAAAYLRHERWEDATRETFAAVQLAERPGTTLETWRSTRVVARHQLRWIDQFWPVCDRPEALGLCVWGL